MPKRKNYRKRYRRKRKNQYPHQSDDKEVQSTGKALQQTVIHRGIGIPSIFLTKLKFNYSQKFNSAAFNDFLIRANSVYDPLYAVGGLQPMYYDELANLYQRYCVLSSSCQVTFVNAVASGEPGFIKVGMYPLGDTTSPANITEATERDNCKYAQLGPNTGDQGIVQMKSYCKNSSIVGKARDENTDDILSADTASNPIRQVYWHIWNGTLDGISNTNIYVDITVTYYVKFYDRRSVGQS